MTKIWPIPGGVHPPERKQQSMQEPLTSAAIPDELVFPLNQHIGAPAVPVVSEGEQVKAGQVIAKPRGIFSAPIHASTSGTIVAIEERTLPHPSGMAGDCIVLKSDGRDEHISYVPCVDYTELDHQQLIEKIRNAGITGMGGASFPTAVKLNPRSNQPIDTLILNGTECEPYITADDMLMQTRPADIVEGAKLLAHVLGQPERVVIGVEDNKPQAIAALKKAASGTSIEVVSFPTKYPSGGEKQVIQILTGREVPSGKLPADVGVVVQNVGTAVAAFEAVRFGKPLISRITTVVGNALQTQRNVIVRLGTPVQALLEQHGFQADKAARLIMGGPMMGFALEDPSVPVVKASNCILVPSAEEIGPVQPAQACIRCGLCAEACPASLLPQQLYWYAQAEDYERLEAHNIKDCIECGACSFVCPSNIPLVQYYRSAKGTLRQMAIEKEKSDRSRARFEFRQERMARAEAEKEAKRQARKKAAEKARSELKKDAPGTAAPEASDVVAAAMAKAKDQQSSPADERARLERAVSSAQARLEKLQQKLSDADETQSAKLQAQIKQTQLKLDDAQSKLNNSGASSAPSAAEPAADSDPVAAAIARAQAKMSMSPSDKLKASISSLESRLEKAKTKLEEAQQQGSDKVEALQSGYQKLQQKLDDAKAELAATTTEDDAKPEPSNAEQDAAAAAIARAQAKAAAMVSQSPEEKLRDQLASLEKRLEKARARLAEAEAAGDDNIDAFRTGVEKTEARLQHTREQLES